MAKKIYTSCQKYVNKKRKFARIILLYKNNLFYFVKFFIRLRKTPPF